ncbi:MAG: glycosyltransferase family 2 protein, partial [Bacillota bacterium]
RSIAEEILERSGRPNISRLTCLIERTHLGLDDDQIQGALGVYLGLALPVVSVLCSLEQSDSPIARSMMRFAAHTHHERTYNVLYTLTCRVSNQLRSQLQALLTSDRLQPALQEAYLLSFPTTQDIVARQQWDLNQRSSGHRLRHVVVPFDFDGKYQGQCLGTMVPSTKGRALNFALPLIDPRSQMCGFYDAESRPEANVLLYVAYRRIQDQEAVQILQGPVFQVRNFYSMGPFTKIVSLYQAISHDWYLPVIFRRLPFVGGTNLFVSTDLLARIKGYDDHSLTEDLELGARAYLKCGAWPEFLPFYSSEQTPPVFRAFFRQRLRWGTGHLQVMEKIRSDTSYPRDKAMMIWRRLFVKGQVEWTLYQTGALLPPLALLLWWLGYIDPSIAPFEVRAVMNGLSLLYFAFTVYAYTRYSPYVDQSARPRDWRGRVGVYGSLVMLPFVAFFFPVPFSTALVLKGLHLEPKIWIKTPRTRE